MKRLWICAFCLVPGALLLAFQNPPAPQTPQFRAGVDVFQLEVTVLDRDRQPVRGLKQSNFSVFENGKPQKLVNFEEIEFPEYEGPLTEAVEDNAPDVVRPQYVNRRLIVVVMDDYGWPLDHCAPVHPELLYVAKEGGRFIVNSMGADDLVAVTLTRDLRYFPDFTNNQGKLSGNIAEFKPPGCAEHEYLAMAARGNRRSIGLIPALDELIDRMAKLPQHSKSIVILGIPLNMRMGGAGDLTLRDVMTHARQAGITISGVDLLGLTVERRDGPDFLRMLAENTGGRAIVGTNDFAPGVAQIFREHHSYYLLGYQQTGPKDGKFRRLEVHVDVPASTVLARSGYTAPGAPEIVPQPLFYDPEVDAAVTALGDPSAARRLFTHATVGPTSIHAVAELASTELVAGRWARGADIEFTVTRASGSVVAKASANVGAGSRSATADIPLVDLQGRPLDSSAAPFHVSTHVASDAGSVDDGVDAIGGGRLVGAPAIFRAASGPRAPLRPVAELRFLRSERIHIEWPTLESIDPPEVHLLRRSGEAMAHTPTLSERDADGRHLIVVDFQLSPLAEGEYVMELAARRGQDAERKFVAFRVAQ